jgi:lysozyme family protein
MANFDPYFPSIIKSEGAEYTNDPVDTGGCTKFGIILQTLKEYKYDVNKDGIFTCEDVKGLTLEDAKNIYKKMFWDYFKADSIKNQSLAEYIVDGAINQGRGTIAKYVQEIIGVTADGLVGNKTLEAINAHDPKDLFHKLKSKREDKYHRIVAKNPSQKRFIKGWINRLNCIEYQA